jgi:hypothetical protein
VPSGQTPQLTFSLQSALYCVPHTWPPEQVVGHSGGAGDGSGSHTLDVGTPPVDVTVQM